MAASPPLPARIVHSPVTSFSGHIDLNLSRKRTLELLRALSQMPQQRAGIQTAMVFTSRAKIGIHSDTTPADVVSIFGLLGNMPNLQSVVVHLNRPCHSDRNGGLPLVALVKLLQRAKRLQTLQLIQLEVTTTLPKAAASWKDLGKRLLAHKHLHNITIANCIGENITEVIAVVSEHARGLQKLRLTGTKVASSALARLTSKVHHPLLQTLALEELPSITKQQVEGLCWDLEDPGCPLQALEIRSSILPEVAADRLTQMLCFNTSLHTVVLHLDCERIVQSMPQCFMVNTSLRQVDLRCYGDDRVVAKSVLGMAQTLSDSPLQRLRLCLEIEPWIHQKDIIQAFASLALTNTSLQQLVLDDGFQTYPLTPELRQQLRLNQCGYSRLVKSANYASAEQWIQVLGQAKGNLNVIYAILTNCPWLIGTENLAVPDTTKNPREPVKDGSSTKLLGDSSSGRRSGRYGVWSIGRSPKRTDGNVPMPAPRGSGNGFQRMIRSIRAPSA